MPEEERILLRRHDGPAFDPSSVDLVALQPPAAHSIFLYDISQLNGDQFPEVAEALRDDLSKYLELETLLPSLSQAQPAKHTANTSSTSVGEIDICDSQYKSLRQELVLMGRDAAEWMIQFFLDLPNVHVSSTDFFRQALDNYQKDPCER